jgi:hypothetical protein
MWAGARELRHWNPSLVDLLLTVCDDSPGWSMLTDLSRLAPSGRAWDEDSVAALLAGELAARAILPHRIVPSDTRSPPAPPWDVPGRIVGDDGRVDPHLLARSYGAPAE